MGRGEDRMVTRNPGETANSKVRVSFRLTASLTKPACVGRFAIPKRGSVVEFFSGFGELLVRKEDCCASWALSGP